MYNPSAGDYPKIKGDEAVFYILNDKNTMHSDLSATALGIELHVMIYSFSSYQESINNTTFINYSIYNRSTIDYSDFCMGSFMDADMACSGDDYGGCVEM